MVKRRNGRRGVFFSLDALIALTIIFVTALIIYPLLQYSDRPDDLGGDVLQVFSDLKVGEVQDAYVQSLLGVEGGITNMDNTLLEQIGEFYVVESDRYKAVAMVESLLANLETHENVGIYIITSGGSEGELIALKEGSTPIEDAENVLVSRQVISGLKEGEDVTGFSARAFLSNNVQTDYYYFGGYVGDGDISVDLEYYGTILPESEGGMSFEIAINKDFYLYINELFAGQYEKSVEEPVGFFQPRYYNPSYEGLFDSGVNTIKFTAVDGGNLYIAGGYIKLVYIPVDVEEQGIKRKYLPGIEGLINIYDGISVPDSLTSMEAYLHFDSDYDLFFNIGDKTIYTGAFPGGGDVTITSAEIETALTGVAAVGDFSSIEGETVPVRLGLDDFEYVVEGYRDVDTFSVTDLSGSMDACQAYNPSYSTYCYLKSYADCDPDPNCYYEDRLTPAKEANNALIDGVFGNPAQDNLMGLVGYQSNVYPNDYHELSNDGGSLDEKVDDWYANGGTCICCGINKAIQGFEDSWRDESLKFMVVMSDGQATYSCSQQGVTGDLNDNGQSDDAGDDAIQAACDAQEIHGITVYTVAFGGNADTDTLDAIAECGHGVAYSGGVDEIVDLYNQIAEEIIEASYYGQTIEVGGGEISTTLYPDSYIEFEYVEEERPYGMILGFEEQFDDVLSGSFTVPAGSEIVEVDVVSYSGSKWTNTIKLNDNPDLVFDLSEYGSEYIELGDPYSISLPVGGIKESGVSNTVEVTTALSPEESLPGSLYNKIIYKILKELAGYSGIVSNADGCIWDIQFEDGTSLDDFKIPSSYAGDEVCSYAEEDYNSNDAMQDAVYKLLEKLDFDLNDAVDFKFNEENLEASSSEVTGIPYIWEIEVQVRVWD